MKRTVFAIAAMLLISVLPVSAATINVTADHGGDLQAAMGAAVLGDIVHMEDGTYTINSTLTVGAGITLQGQSQAGAVIDVNTGNSWGIHVDGDNVSLETFTANVITSTGIYQGYVIHASEEPVVTGFTGLTIQDVTVQGSGSGTVTKRRSGIDIHGFDNVTIDGVTSQDATWGNGFQITGCEHVTVDNSTTLNNAWGSLAVYVSGWFSPARPCDDVVIDGATCSFGEGNVFTEDIVGYASTNITVTGYEYYVRNTDFRAGAEYFTFFQDTYLDAVAAALAYTGYEDASSIEEIATGQFFTAPGMSIQAAIDGTSPGGTVNVDAGTYREQLYIDKSLDLTGAGSGVCTIEAEDAGGRSIYQVTQWNASLRDVDACIGVFEAGTVNITGFTVDGRETGPGNFYGIHFFDTSGSVTYCAIDRVIYPAGGGSQRVVNLSGSHSLGETVTLDFSHNTMPDFQKGGILVMGPGSSFTVDDNAVNDVYTGAIAGNGIQLSYGASGTTNGNVVQGVGYTGSGWVGTGILLFESGDITMTGDEVFDCQSGVNYSDWRWVYAHPVPVNLSLNDLNLHDNEWTLGAQLSGEESDLNIDIDNCLILDSLADGIDLFGTADNGSYYTGWNNGDLVATITNCTISGTAAGYDGLWTGDSSGNATNTASVDVHQTSFSNNGNSAVNNDFPTAGIDAEYCWWDDAAGPTDGGPVPDFPRSRPMIAPIGAELAMRGGHAYTAKIEQAGRAGETVFGTVDYTPWLGMVVLDMDPASSGPISCGGISTLDFNYTPDAGFTPPLRGYDIRVTASSEVSFTESDITVHSLVTDPEYMDIVENGTNDYTISYAILGATSGVTGSENFFDIIFHGDNAGAHSAATVSVISCELRGLDNAPIGSDYSATASIDVDCLASDVPTMSAEPAYTQGLSNTVSWSDESGSGAVLYYAEIATDAGFTMGLGNSGWIAGTSNLFGGLSDGQIYYYRVKSKDTFDNESALSASVSSTQDDSPPATSADALPTYQTAATFDVAWTGADTDPGSGLFSGLATVELWYSYESGAWTQYGTTFAASPISFASVDGDGDYDFYTVGTDNVGNVEAAPGSGDATTQLDTTAPTGTFVINNDDVYTTVTGVTLNNSVTDATSGINQMRFRDAGGSWSTWETYAATKGWTLPGPDGVNNVEAEFSDMAGNVFAISDGIILDTAAPGVVSDVDATPAHEEVVVTWTDPGDGDLLSVEIFRAVWHLTGGGNEQASAYPEYDDDNPAEPVRPTDYADAGTSLEWISLGTVPAGTGTFTDAIVARGIYYYELFAIDMASNPSAVAAANDRATNYHLGDMPVYDGLVDAGDITVLGAAFGTVSGDGDYDNEADVGPTDTAQGDGIPATDNEIGFEDLMIFALNYGNVAPLPAFPGSEFAHLSWFALEDGAWGLGLTEPCANMKAIQLQAQVPDGIEVTLEGGGLLNQQAGPVFLRQIPGNGLDVSLAVMGEDVVISGQGLLFSVTLPDGMFPTDMELTVRSADNTDLEFELSATEVADLPTSYRFAGNFPNPFNPKTSISFDLPQAQNVQLVVFSADGRRVVTLLDEQVAAGRHSIAWSGRDENGASVASGVYFARIQAGPLKETHKMLLLK